MNGAGMMRRTATFMVCVSLALLAGCGDGGGSSGTSAPTYSVGGTVAGLSGSGLTLRNGNDTLKVNSNGSFTLPTKLASGASYNVVVDTYPSGPVQACTVQNGSGTVTNADVTAITVNCTTSPSTYAYAVVTHSAADSAVSLIEYFAFDPVTGGLSLQGTVATPQNTFIWNAKATPSGRQLLASTSIVTHPTAPSGNTEVSDDKLTLYDLLPATGAPSQSTVLSSTNRTREVIFHPNGNDLYTIGSPIIHYSLASGAAQGQSLSIGDSGAPASEFGASASAITPDGKFLFVPGSMLVVSQQYFHIAVVSLADPLQPQLALEVPTTTTPLTAAISPDGHLMYVTNAPQLGYVYQVGSTGGLTQAGSFTPPANPRSAVIVPSGNFLYIASADDNKVQGYRLDGTGGVTPLGSGTTVPSPFRLTLSLDGKFLYVLSAPLDQSKPAAIYGFAIGTDGALGPIPGLPFANGERPGDLTFAKANP
jgi:hypothetical protein